ncbi:ubiquitin carboxyl-terminal hydrolase 38 isoform X1 [Nerophis lumbriciformis]|uniref:ubiquitin carboxyl-terminal hydrolase 38 isoform X1 n=2 Tax=Nerophis lumbriciformis TaxID=546530 RepID=UPI002ADF49EC|nr:ubiquitin carboxyl-terminal hydrolase 38 isoform X1 [Nerophis lumbriciformis]
MKAAQGGRRGGGQSSCCISPTFPCTCQHYGDSQGAGAGDRWTPVVEEKTAIMDKILEGLISSDHKVPVKKAIVKKVVEAAEKDVAAEECRALFTVTTRLILLGEDAFQKQVGFQVLEAYARYHRSEFECFFSKDFVLGLLHGGYEQVERKDPALVDFIHCGLRLLISCPAVLELFSVIQVEVLRLVCERPNPALCARLSTMLSDFVQCVPRDKAGVFFCQQLVRTISYFHCMVSQEQELGEYVSQVTKVSTLLQNIWKAEPATLLPSLQEVFAIISSTDPSFEPSIALASLVQHIPVQMITVLIKSLTTDQNVKDANMTKALCRMIDWLSWPLAHHVDTWVIALLKGLAAVQKFTILIDVTLLKIERVFNRLWYPIVRQGALAVLSHMLLSFQHSPEAFHLVIPNVVHLVQSLQADGLPSSKAFLLQFTELIHCMMYQYSGFPDLYDHILEAIKDLPKPSEEKVKLVLNQSAWTSQSNAFTCGPLRQAGKSETGKTGLVNLGNTCYMNSILQTLFMATDFRRHVLSLQLNGSNILMKKLQLLFAFLAHTQRAAYAPRNFLEASRPPWFNVGSQQDCSEYLRFLLDRLHEEEKTIQVLESTKPSVAPAALLDSSSKDPIGQTSPEESEASSLSPAESKAEEDTRTVIERTFGGKLVTGIRCMHCNGTSEKGEPFTDLSLAFCPSAASQDAPKSEGTSSEPKVVCQGSVNGGSEAPVPGCAADQASQVYPSPETSGPPLSVPDLVDYLLAPEILDQDNAYFCEKCGCLQRAEKTMKVVSAPEYLILTLLRFSYDAKFHVRRKILENVTIPPHLRLPVHNAAPLSCTSSPLQVDSPESSENLAKKLKPSQKDEDEDESEAGRGDVSMQAHYVLSSVVMHSGVSSESGHYYSYGHDITAADGDPADPFKEDARNVQGECGALPGPAGQGSTPPARGPEASDWLLFNDSRVTYASFRSVQNITNRFPKDTAYVLMYRKQELEGQRGNKGPLANGLRQSAEPPLQKELLDAIIKDNKLYLQEQELNARSQAMQAPSSSCSFRPNGSDDNNPPGSCGPSGGGGGGGGFNTISRLVF